MHTCALGCPGLLVFLAKKGTFLLNGRAGGHVFTSGLLILGKLGDVLALGE